MKLFPGNHPPKPQIDAAQLLDIANEVRAFLTPIWEETLLVDGRDSARLSAGLCKVASKFLQKVLKQRGIDADFRFSDGFGEHGFFNGTEMKPHAWLRAGASIVDITADQFDGQPPVIVTTVDDPRYRPPRWNFHTLDQKDDRKLTLWWNEWQYRLAQSLPKPAASEETAPQLKRYSA